MSEIQKLIESFGCKLYDIEIEKAGRTIYRVLVFKEGGVSLDLLAEITRALSPLLDVKPPLSDAYYLEVSSPGLERKLKTKDHFLCSLGETVRIQVGSKKYKGKLLSADKDIVILAKNGEESFKLEDIVSAKTIFEWKSETVSD
jgi:ribosome maturation factor RimP